jgi:hypothetical protein
MLNVALYIVVQRAVIPSVIMLNAISLIVTAPALQATILFQLRFLTIKSKCSSYQQQTSVVCTAKTF